jgi:hypothetical protein
MVKNTPGIYISEVEPQMTQIYADGREDPPK